MVFWFIIEHTMLPIFFLVVLGYFLDKKFHLDVKIGRASCRERV